MVKVVRAAEMVASQLQSGLAPKVPVVIHVVWEGIGTECVCVCVSAKDENYKLIYRLITGAENSEKHKDKLIKGHEC